MKNKVIKWLNANGFWRYHYSGTKGILYVHTTGKEKLIGWAEIPPVLDFKKSGFKIEFQKLQLPVHGY